MIAAFRPFKHRNFTLLWSANLVSNIGTWMETIAVGAILARDTKKAAALGIAAAASFVPMALLAPVGGLISDRVHRKKFLLGTLAFDLFLAIVLAALIAPGHRSPALLSSVMSCLVMMPSISTSIEPLTVTAMITRVRGSKKPEDSIRCWL